MKRLFVVFVLVCAVMLSGCNNSVKKPTNRGPEKVDVINVEGFVNVYSASGIENVSFYHDPQTTDSSVIKLGYFENEKIANEKITLNQEEVTIGEAGTKFFEDLLAIVTNAKLEEADPTATTVIYRIDVKSEMGMIYFNVYEDLHASIKDGSSEKFFSIEQSSIDELAKLFNLVSETKNNHPLS